MNSSQLLRTRLLFPGVHIALLLGLLGALLFPAVRSLAISSGLIASLASFSALLLVAYVLGAAYRVTGLRDVLVHEYFTAVQANIVVRMRVIAHAEEGESQVVLHHRPKFFLDLFYRLVDNDRSLSVRSEHVRLNGAILTSIADFAAINVVFSGFFALAAALAPQQLNFAWATGLLVLGWAFWGLVLPARGRKHLELSNGQLDFIAQEYATPVRDAFRAALQELSGQQQQPES